MSSAITHPADSDARLRLDKWLWAVRFYKTRPLAVEAINGGHVRLNGQRPKPGKELRVGDRVEITKGPLAWELEVLALPRQRRPAPEARACYRESADSLARREQAMAAQKLARAAQERVSGRPTKRDRRLIHRFTQSGD